MTRLLVASVIAGIAALAGPAQAQTIQIRGRVVAADTNDALPHARVVIYKDATPSAPIFTDAQGRFGSPPLARARYRLTVVKSGYAVATVAGANIGTVDLDVRMRRAGAISGRVVDQFGDPAAGVAISLLAPPTPDGTSDGVLFKRATTDDAGNYRFGALQEGTYVVSATTQQQDETGQFVRTVTYYPGVTERTGAQRIAIRPGDDRTGIDFTGIGSQPNEFTTTSQIVIQNNVVFVGPAGTPTTPRPVIGNGVIRGTVTRNDGAPIAHATVTTRAPQTFLGRTTSGPRAVQTDETGRYEIGDLPPGQYRISAAKLGFTSASYGEQADARGTPVELAEGQIQTRIDIVVPRYSTVTGRIVDDFGDPVEGVMVNLAQLRFQEGRRRLTGVRGVAARSTDDLGRYRLYGVQPGQYIVHASPGQIVPNQQFSDLSGYAPTYFPGTPSAAQARRVQVAQSQDVTGLDFELIPTPTATISGTRVGSDGLPFGGSLTLMESQRSGAIITPATGARIHEEDGRFEFPNVAPGDYVIQADRGKQSGDEGDFASQYVTINGHDVSDLLLQSTPGSTISGTVIFDGDGPPPEVGALSVIPARADLDRTPRNGSIGRADVAQDLTFQMTGLHGPRRIAIDRPPAGWNLKSVIANGVDVTDTALTFGMRDDSLSGVQVVLTDRLTELLGAVVDTRGQATRDFTLLVFSADRERWYAGSRYFRRARPEAAGYADVRGLPPGDYFVAPVSGMSVLREGADAWQDPEFLESMTQRATRVTLIDGQKLSISARVITP